MYPHPAGVAGIGVALAATTFHFEDSDSGGVLVTANFPRASDAARARLGIQSLAGTRLEGDGGFLYAVLDASQVVEAADQLRAAGFGVDLGLCTPSP